MMEEADIIEEFIENLKRHANCKTAYFQPSCNRIKVITQNNESKVLTVKNLNKRRKEALDRPDSSLWARVRASFLETCDAAIAFLEGKHPGPHDVAEASDTTQGEEHEEEEQGAEDKEEDEREEEQGDEDKDEHEKEEQGAEDEAEDAHEHVVPEGPP